MGTPDFAVKSLRALFGSGREVVGVFTQPDRPRGRGRRVAPTPVKEQALEYGAPVFQPETLRGGAALSALEELAPDMIAVTAYGKLLPPEILALPPLGCVNIHGSLLPKYRGAAPVQRAIMDGETVTGVTSIFMAPGLDEGDIILSRNTDIGDGETFGQLYERLGEMGARLLVETADAIEAGAARAAAQDSSAASYAPPITKQDAVIDWTAPADAIIRKIRALDPRPAASADMCGTRMKLFAARRADIGAGDCGKPGDVLAESREGIAVACGDGAVLITELQAPGGARMAARDYLRGHSLARARETRA
jgi:methionyl-tRNA formyltransferase